MNAVAFNKSHRIVSCRDRKSSVRSLAIFGFLDRLKEGIMGNSSSASSPGWTPAPSTSMPRVTSISGFDITPLTKEQKAEAAQQLNGMARYVALEHGTERPFTGKVHACQYRGPTDRFNPFIMKNIRYATALPIKHIERKNQCSTYRRQAHNNVISLLYTVCRL